MSVFLTITNAAHRGVRPRWSGQGDLLGQGRVPAPRACHDPRTTRVRRIVEDSSGQVSVRAGSDTLAVTVTAVTPALTRSPGPAPRQRPRTFVVDRGRPPFDHRDSRLGLPRASFALGAGLVAEGTFAKRVRFSVDRG